MDKIRNLIVLSVALMVLACAGCTGNDKKSTVTGINASGGYNKSFGTDAGTFEIFSPDRPINFATPNSSWVFEYGVSGDKRVYGVYTAVNDVADVSVSVRRPDGNVSYARDLEIIRKEDGYWYLEGDHKGFDKVALGGPWNGSFSETMYDFNETYYNEGDWDTTPYRLKDPGYQKRGVIVLEGFI